MNALIFAYGSNMLTSRLKKRARSAEAIDNAMLLDWQVIFNKKGKDGSGKANLLHIHGSSTWGVLYKILEEELRSLDRSERGYKRKKILLQLQDGKKLRADAYFSDDLTDNPVALDSYKRYIVDGAIEHNLPAGYIQYLRSLPSRPDITKS